MRKPYKLQIMLFLNNYDSYNMESRILIIF